MKHQMAVYLDEKLANYGFGPDHPFNNARYAAFRDAFLQKHLDERVAILQGYSATVDELSRFHEYEYIDFVKKMSTAGYGLLDTGDTPAFLGVFEAAAQVVGCTLHATHEIAKGLIKRAFIPIAGLHHAGRDHAAGFCVFNDIGVAIETLRSSYQIKTIAYVDIDVHHGDGVFYAFENDPNLIFADIHEEGIYPGSGQADEQGKGKAKGRKLNIPLAPFSGDDVFLNAFKRVIQFIEMHQPEFIIFQCGADSIANDLLGGLRYSTNAHAYAAKRLRALADTFAKGRMLALGGGGYNLKNIAEAWTAVVGQMVENV